MLAWWFTFTLSRSSLKVKVIAKGLRSQEENVAKAVGVTSTEVFLVLTMIMIMMMMV